MTPPHLPFSSSENSPQNLPLSWFPTREDLYLLLEASGEGLFVTDREGCILSLNPVAQQMIGRNHDVTGRTIHDLFHCISNSSEGPNACPLQEVFRSGEVGMLGEHRWTRPDGTVLELSATFWPRRKGLEVIGAVVVCRDLTAEWEVQREIQRVARLAEDAPNPIVEFNEFGTMLYANNAMVELINKKGETENPIETVLPQPLEAILRQCIETKVPTPRYEHVLDGMVLAWSFFPLGITANVELRHAKAAAEEAAKAKGTFLATMSHELRTPMHGVLGCTQLLQETSLTDQQRELIVTMQRSAEALLALVNDILDFSKIEASKMTLEVADVDLRLLVKDVVTLVAELAKKKDLTLRTSIADDLPSLFRGDPVRLRQVLFNLAGNAIKFTERGSVEITLSLDAPAAPVSDTSIIRWTITDTGIGMTKPQQERLFQAYSQAETSTARRFGGTGLGLMICRQLVTMMGGTIAVESTPGQGSTFSYTTHLLPAIVRTAVDGPEVSSVSEATESRGPRRVLVADDNEINQVVACKFLQKLGHHVEVARNGREAVESLGRTTYDAVLMDCEMPVMDGYEAARSIREGEKTGSRRLPIIAMTGNASLDDVLKCKDAGMDEVVTKPVTLTALRDTLERLLTTISK
jgi:hypothetical protein